MMLFISCRGIRLPSVLRKLTGRQALVTADLALSFVVQAQSRCRYIGGSSKSIGPHDLLRTVSDYDVSSKQNQ